MVSRKLVEEIERNAGKLAADLVESLRHDERASAYANLTDAQFRGVIRDLYGNLGHWLQSRTWNKLRQVYELKGRERCHGGMPLEQLIYSLTKTKQRLLDFIQNSMTGDASERDLEIRLIVSVSEFFDRAIYHTICGYEDARRTQARVQALPRRETVVVAAESRRVVVTAVPSSDEYHISRGGDVGEVSG